MSAAPGCGFSVRHNVPSPPSATHSVFVVGSKFHREVPVSREGIGAQELADALKNAALFAAAPEMLAALREVLAVFDSAPGSIVDTVWVTGGVPETLRDRCAAAIEKATGVLL